MKMLMLAALAVAAPAFAQDTAPQTPQTMPADPAPTEAMPADPAAPMPADPAQTAPMPADPAPMAAPMAAPGGPPAGATVRYQPLTPDQPPAPLAKYPMCKKGQTDHCMQRGGK